MWAKRKTKYNAVKVKHAGYSFASQLEAGLFYELKLLEETGAVTDIKLQPHVYLTKAKILMIPDFSAFDVKADHLVYFEAKGFETDVWRIKRRLWMKYGPAPLRIYFRQGKGLFLKEELVPYDEE